MVLARPLAAVWGGDVRFALRELVLRMVPWLETMALPLGAVGSLHEVIAFAHAVPPAPHAGAYRELVTRLELTPTEELVLIAALSPDLNPRLVVAWQVLGVRLDAMRPRLSSLLALATAEERRDVLAVLESKHVLRALGLVTVEAGRDASPIESVLMPSAALLGTLEGRDPDANELGVLVAWPSGDVDVPERVAAIAREPIARGVGATAIVVDGPGGSGRGWIARSIAAAAGRGTASVVLDPGRPGQLAALARVALLEQLIPVVEVRDGDDVAALLAPIAQVCRGPWIIVCDGTPTLDPPWTTIRLTTHRPDVRRRQELWRLALGGHEELAVELTRRFPLGVRGIFRAAELGIFRAGGAIQAATIAAAARDELDVQTSVAERVRTSHRLTDLVLPAHTRGLLEEILAFARARRRVFDEWGFARRAAGGLKVLFSGPPGTGKTLSAQVIAGELDLDLFRIDLSSVVSKWIGETEKNLRRAFDEADANGGILLFDEADSLFGKRTADVKSSSDRYANLEVNYLLQRMEQHDGIVLLTTNLETGIDEAFRRRLNFRVRFSAPEAEERAALWRLMIPAQTPVGERLAFDVIGKRFDMAGGNIKNAALRAAVLAASENSPLLMRHLLIAGEREFGEIGRISNV